MENFKQYCVNFINENLGDYEGQVFYACDVYSYITESINNIGCAPFTKGEAIEYMKEWLDDVAKYFNYESSEFGYHAYNPFEEPSSYLVCMIIEGVRRLMAQCEEIDASWNDEIELTEEVIKSIKEQVEDFEIEW